MRTAASLALLVLVACAGARPAPEELPDKPAGAPVALAPTPSGSVSPGGKSNFNAKVWVSWQDGAADCEASARAMRDNSAEEDRKSTRLNSSHVSISYAVFCLKKKKREKP